MPLWFSSNDVSILNNISGPQSLSFSSFQIQKGLKKTRINKNHSKLSDLVPQSFFQ